MQSLQRVLPIRWHDRHFFACKTYLHWDIVSDQHTQQIAGFFAKLPSVSTAAKTKFSKAAAYFCAKDLRPFEAMKGDGFRKLVKTILEIGSMHGVVDVDSLLPDPTTVSRQLATIAKDMREKLKNQMQPVFLEFGGAITIDFWTDDYQKKPYLSVTGHYIDNDWQLKDVLIGIYGWDAAQRQTADNIYPFLLEKLNEFGLTNREKFVFVTDEGSNLKKALENECRLNCTAHVLNTALKTTFEQEAKQLVTGPEIQTLQACKDLVSLIRQSRIKAQLSKAVVPDVDTRWHSKVDMVESVLKLWDEIEQVLMEHDQEYNKNDSELLNAIDRTKLEQLFAVIAPFRQAILQVETSSNYPTLPLVVLIYQKLLNSLAPVEGEERWVKMLKRKLLESVQRKLVLVREHRIATILHPSYRKLEMPCVNGLDKRQAISTIRLMMSAGTRQESDGGDESASTGPTLNKRSRVAVDAFLDEFCTPDRLNLNDELDRYLADTVDRVSITDILHWWKASSKTYPKLSAVARKYLAVPATSAASESSFRYAGLTVTELRNTLSPETVTDLLFVHHYKDK